MNKNLILSVVLFIPVILLSIPTEYVYSQDDDEGTIRVTKLKIKGNKAIDTKEIRLNIETQSPSIKPWVKKPKFDLDVFRDDIERIKDLFANNGYYDAIVDYKLEYNDSGNEVKIYIDINQGEPVLLRSLNIVIEDKDPAEGENIDYEDIREEILRRMPLEQSKIFSALKFEEAKGLVNLVLSSRGYPKHEVEAEALVNRSEKWAEVNFKIAPGLKYTFGSIEIIGNQKIPTYLVRRELIYDPGETYSLAKVSESQTRDFSARVF